MLQQSSFVPPLTQNEDVLETEIFWMGSRENIFPSLR